MTRISIHKDSSPQHSASTSSTNLPDPVTILILGQGWTSDFLLPLLRKNSIAYAGTTRNGHDNTIPFNFNPSDHEPKDEDFEVLPPADFVLITFPVKGEENLGRLVSMYWETHPEREGEYGKHTKWILLGSTLIWKSPGFNDENSGYDEDNERGRAEDGLLYAVDKRAAVLDLAGLYGGQRHPRNWLTRVAKSKEDVKKKGALHLVHGEDVARAILLSMENWEKVAGERWILTDGWSYDWWGLFVEWGPHARREAEKDNTDMAKELQFEKWVWELLQEEKVRSLPRDKELLGRLMDGRAFWNAVGSAPSIGRAT